MKLLFLILIGCVFATPLSADLVQLSLAQVPKEDAVAQLGDLLSELRKEQSLDDQQHAQTLAKLEADQTILQSQLEAQVNQLKTTNTQIGDLSEDIYTLSKTSANLNQQLSDLTARDISLRDAQFNDQQSFDTESAQARRSINALSQIIGKLTDAVLSQSSFIQKQEIVDSIKNELGSNHPVALLVEVTSKFDSQTVKNIILKLEHIQSQQEQQLISSEQNWTVQQQTYQTLLNQISEVSKKLSYDVKQIQTNLGKKQNDKVLAEKRRDNLNITVPQLQTALSNVQQQVEAYDLAYSARKNKRTQEIEVLRNAFEILVKKAEIHYDYFLIKMQPGSYPLTSIQKLSDIEQYDQLDENGAYVIETEKQYRPTPDQKLTQIQNNLDVIANNLNQFSDLVKKMGESFTSRPLQTNIKERTTDELMKSFACKLKTINEVQRSFKLKEYLQQKKEEEAKIKQSIDELTPYFSFASTDQLQKYARAFKPPKEGANFIYANLYHDTIEEEIPYLKLITKENKIQLHSDQLELNANETLVLELYNHENFWVSWSAESITSLERVIYNYIKKKQKLKTQILDYTLQFRYVNNDDFNEQFDKFTYSGFLFIKLLYELFIKQNGNLDKFIQFITVFILENNKQDLMDNQRYQGLLNFLENPEKLQMFDK